MNGSAPSPRDGATPHQFQLLAQRRYGPFFGAMFLGAFNDNLLKFVVMLVLTYQSGATGLTSEQVGPVLGAVFILPSVLWSVLAGEVVDRWDLDLLIRWGKAAEALMMGCAAVALWQRSVVALMACVFASGVHVTLFATIKYAYPPRHLASHELLGGNGLLEMGTFTAILLGTVLGGWCLSGASGTGQTLAGLDLAVGAMLLTAALGWWLAHQVPTTPAPAPGLRLQWGLLAAAWRTVAASRRQAEVWPALLGISWMWAFGAVMFSLFPAIAKDVLHADPGVAAALLVVSTVGVAAGALACERLSRGHAGRGPDLGLVLPGGLMMLGFGWHLGQTVESMALNPEMASALQFGWHWWGLVDLTAMSMGVALFSVPWYARMQAHADPARRARLVGANNLLNALYILVASLGASALLGWGWRLGQVMMSMSALHGLWLLWALWRWPVLRTDARAWWRRRRGAA